MRITRTVKVVDFASLDDLARQWPKIVGAQIAAVSHPRSVSRHGVLRVGVTTQAWLDELAGMEPQLRRFVQARVAGIPIERIRFQRVGPAQMEVRSTFIPRIIA